MVTVSPNFGHLIITVSVAVMFMLSVGQQAAAGADRVDALCGHKVAILGRRGGRPLP